MAQPTWCDKNGCWCKCVGVCVCVYEEKYDILGNDFTVHDVEILWFVCECVKIPKPVQSILNGSISQKNLVSVYCISINTHMFPKIPFQEPEDHHPHTSNVNCAFHPLFYKIIHPQQMRLSAKQNFHPVQQTQLTEIA